MRKVRIGSSEHIDRLKTKIISAFDCLKYGVLALVIVQALGAPVEETWNEQEQDHELIGGFYQGDMEIELTRNGQIAESRRWPNGVVRYKIAEVFDSAHVAYILRAMQIIEDASCIRFVPADKDTSAYVYIAGEPSGCHSTVGYSGKQQNLNLQVDFLDKGCFKIGTITHEILHSLGFHHQQSASNRDDYVRIVEENITEDTEHNFKKYDENTVTDFGIEYDYASILHYSSTAFSKNGEKTIVPLQDENIEIGQRRGMSYGDIAKLNLMYNCPIFN